MSMDVPISASEITCDDDVSLTARLRQNDAAAFEIVVRRHGGRMLTVARQLLNDEHEAQDALQDALLTAFRSLSKFEGRSSLSTWLHRIVVNSALMKLRNRKRRGEQSIDNLLPTFIEDGHQSRPISRWNESADSILEREETRRIIREKIDELPEIHRSVLILRDIQELNTMEVADLLQISPEAVKVRLHRARQALRTLLDSVFGNEPGRGVTG